MVLPCTKKKCHRGHFKSISMFSLCTKKPVSHSWRWSQMLFPTPMHSQARRLESSHPLQAPGSHTTLPAPRCMSTSARAVHACWGDGPPQIQQAQQPQQLDDTNVGGHTPWKIKHGTQKKAGLEDVQFQMWWFVAFMLKILWMTCGVMLIWCNHLDNGHNHPLNSWRFGEELQMHQIASRVTRHQKHDHKSAQQNPSLPPGCSRVFLRAHVWPMPCLPRSGNYLLLDELIPKKVHLLKTVAFMTFISSQWSCMILN